MKWLSRYVICFLLRCIQAVRLDILLKLSARDLKIQILIWSANGTQTCVENGPSQFHQIKFVNIKSVIICIIESYSEIHVSR